MDGFFDFGSLFSAPFALLGNWMSNKSQQKQTRETNQLNYKMHQEDIANQLQMQSTQNAFNSVEAEKARAFNSAEAQKAFEREAAWNSPANQKAMMLEAGLNPYSDGGGAISTGEASGQAATGQPATGSAPSVPSPLSMGTPPGSFSGLSSSIGDIAGALAALSQAGYNDKQTKLLKGSMDALIKKAENDAELSDIAVNLEHQLSPLKVQQQRKAVDFVTKQISELQTRIELNRKQGKKLDSDIDLNGAIKQAHLSKAARDVVEPLLENYKLTLMERQTAVQETLVPSQIKANEGAAAAGFGAGQLSTAQAKVVNDTHDAVVRIQNALVDVQEADAYVRKKVFKQQADTLLQQLEDAKELSPVQLEMVRTQLQLAEKELANYNWQHNVLPIIGTLADVVGMFLLFKGMTSKAPVSKGLPVQQPVLQTTVPVNPLSPNPYPLIVP